MLKGGANWKALHPPHSLFHPEKVRVQKLLKRFSDTLELRIKDGMKRLSLLVKIIVGFHNLFIIIRKCIKENAIKLKQNSKIPLRRNSVIIFCLVLTITSLYIIIKQVIVRSFNVLKFENYSLETDSLEWSRKTLLYVILLKLN